MFGKKDFAIINKDINAQIVTMFFKINPEKKFGFINGFGKNMSIKSKPINN